MILIDLRKIQLGKGINWEEWIFEILCRLQSQVPRVRPPRRQQQGAKNPLRQIQATITTLNEYTEVHTDLSEHELRRLKRAQSMKKKNLVYSSSHRFSSCWKCWCRSRSLSCFNYHWKFRRNKSSKSRSITRS